MHPDDFLDTVLSLLFLTTPETPLLHSFSCGTQDIQSLLWHARSSVATYGI